MMIDKNKKRLPDFKGDGVAVWANEDKNGKQFLTIKVLDSFVINAFQFEKKDETKSDKA